LLAGATVAIVLLIVFLSKWSSLLGREVHRRTSALELSNEEIRLHLDFVQKKWSVLKERLKVNKTML
jgi:hypothetical protein